MSVQSFQIFSASCVECAAVTAMCQASVMSWRFSFRTSWSSSRPAPRSNQLWNLTIHSHHSPTGCTMHQLQSKKPCSWWSKCANAWCKWPCAHAHTWTITTHHRTTELSRDMRRYAIWKGLMTSYSNHKLSMQSNKQQYAGRCWLVESDLQINSLDDVTSHRLWSRKLLELRQCICHRAWRYFHWKQCRITFSTVKCISSSTTDVKWWATRIHA